MKILRSLCFVLMIIGVLLTFGGCTKNTVDAADTTQNLITQDIITQDFTTQDIITEDDIGNENVNLEEFSFLSDRLSLLIPTSFSIMSEEMAALKYPSERRPSVIYTNESGSVNVAFRLTESEASQSQIPENLNILKKSFEIMYPSAQWYTSGVVFINEKRVGFLELLTPAADSEIYNLIWFTDLDGKLLLTTFNCTKEQMDNWKPIAKTIMDSQKYFDNSSTIKPSPSDSQTYIIEDYSIQVTYPAEWQQLASDEFALLCLSEDKDLAMSIGCHYESDLQGTKEDYYISANQGILIDHTNKRIQKEMTVWQYDDKTIVSFLCSGENEGTTFYYYSNLISFKDSGLIAWVLFMGGPSDFITGTETYDKILQEIKPIES